jgi:hypothetical protein
MNRPRYAIFPAGFAIVFILLFARGAPAQQYTSQTFIDTTIQKAYYNLNAATDVSGMGMKMEDAISSAKQIANRLKTIAKGNPNEKYILWKVGELESQIYLEESGLLLEKNQKRQKLVNDLVAPFNAEIGKRRPDFSRLADIHNKALSIDHAKAFDFGTTLEDRKKNVRREAAASLEKAVTEGDFDLAWQELVYLKNNQEPLGISLTQYSIYAAKVQAKIKLDSEREFITGNANTIDALIAKNKFSEARNALGVLEDRVSGIQGLAMKTEWDRYFFRNKRLRESLERKEDSLVRVNTAILRDQGIVAADDYLEGVLKKLGVFHEKIARMELAILEKAMAYRKLQDTAVVKQLASISTPATNDSSSLFSDLVGAAKKKAQEKADSAKLAQEGNVRHTSAEELRLANMRVSQELKQKRDEEILKENKMKANKLIIDIYVLLDLKQTQKAYDEYTDHQAFLARHVFTASFVALDSTVNAEYAAFKKKKK